MSTKNLSLALLLFLISITTLSFTEADKADCVYTIYVRTGSIFKAGTDSIISVELYNDDNDYIAITNLEAWGGLMGPDYDYFKRGNLDIFSGRGACLKSPICAIKLTSDGSGPHPGWYCKYVKVTSTRVHTDCAQQQFEIHQWLATDTPPYQLTAFRNKCPCVVVDGHDDRKIIKLESDKPTV